MRMQKLAVKGQAVQQLEWKQTDAQTDRRNRNYCRQSMLHITYITTPFQQLLASH